MRKAVTIAAQIWIQKHGFMGHATLKNNWFLVLRTPTPLSDIYHSYKIID